MEKMEKELNENSNMRELEKELKNLELERKRIQKLIENEKGRLENIIKFHEKLFGWTLSIMTSLILIFFILKFFIPLLLDNFLDDDIKIENGIVFRTFLVSLVNITTLPFLCKNLGSSRTKKLHDFFYKSFIVFGLFSLIPFEFLQTPFSEENLPNTLYYLVFLFHSLVSWVVVSNIKVGTDE
jgi:hypothetical protein